jgi:hypothetical protein
MEEKVSRLRNQDSQRLTLTAMLCQGWGISLTGDYQKEHEVYNAYALRKQFRGFNGFVSIP